VTPHELSASRMEKFGQIYFSLSAQRRSTFEVSAGLGGLQCRMNFELVIKFWRKPLPDEAVLSMLTSEFKSVLGDTAELDGHDVRDEEINLFVITDDPKRAFRRIKKVLEARGIDEGFSAASRLVGGAHFTSIWPLRATRKFKLP
jgi:hypothetical protein